MRVTLEFHSDEEKEMKMCINAIDYYSCLWTLKELLYRDDKDSINSDEFFRMLEKYNISLEE